MPKVAQRKNPHDDIKYHCIKTGEQKGCYQLHNPTECRLIFPPRNKLIHKCENVKDTKEKTDVFQFGVGTGLRQMIIPSREPNYYPAVMDTAEYERLKKQARIWTQEDEIAAWEAKEKADQKQAREAAKRKQRLREKLLPQPGAEAASGEVDTELEGPDQTAHTLSRAELLQADNMQGPRLCNRIILASKCHAIRDAQTIEKKLIKKELAEEEKRLDAIMEENRLAAIARAEAEEKRIHQLRLNNLEALKEQIKAHEVAKVMEAERVEEEAIRMNQANIAMQIEEVKKLKEKHQQQLKLKEMLDQGLEESAKKHFGNAEILYYKQIANEEERIMDMRIKKFEMEKRAREAKNKADAAAIQAAKKKGIDHVSSAQKAEKALKEELERIRNLKILEDVEREYRRKERAAAIKRNNDMRELHIARNEQIKNIHRTIAREIAQDEQAFNNAARQNEEFLRKQKEEDDKRKAIIEKHRQAIMKQINDKERDRAETRQRIQNEGVALRMEQEQQDKYEKKIIKMKVNAMREQKIPEKYVKEVEQILGKHGYN